MADDSWQQGPWGAADIEQLAQRYWSAWSDTMRKAASGGGGHAGTHAGMQAWHDAVDWWTHQAYGNRVGINDALERFNTQARAWYGQMQKIAAQFAGRDSTARDIAAAWRESLGASGRIRSQIKTAWRGRAGPGSGRVALLDAIGGNLASCHHRRGTEHQSGCAAGAGEHRIPGSQRLQR